MCSEEANTMTTNKAGMSKKANTLTASNWLKNIQKFQDSFDFRQNAQKIFHQIGQQPNIEQQQADLDENFQLLLERPLIRLQTQRLFQKHLQQGSTLEQTFFHFQIIWSEQVSMSPNTLKQLDPNYISPRYANADTSRYKNYLTHLLFLILCIDPIEMKAPQYLPNFVQWINGIEQARTTEKTSLRIMPNIKSEVLLELPKHSVVSVYVDANPLWKKIRFVIDHQERFGYVMTAYLKFQG